MVTFWRRACGFRASPRSGVSDGGGYRTVGLIMACGSAARATPIVPDPSTTKMVIVPVASGTGKKRRPTPRWPNALRPASLYFFRHEFDHADRHRGSPAKKRQQLRPPQPLAYSHLMNLKHRLCQVDANHCNRFHRVLLSTQTIKTAGRMERRPRRQLRTCGDHATGRLMVGTYLAVFIDRGLSSYGIPSVVYGNSVKSRDCGGDEGSIF